MTILIKKKGKEVETNVVEKDTYLDVSDFFENVDDEINIKGKISQVQRYELSLVGCANPLSLVPKALNLPLCRKTFQYRFSP